MDSARVRENKPTATGNGIHWSFHRMGLLVQQLLRIGTGDDAEYCPVHDTSIVDTIRTATDGFILERKLKKVSSFMYPLAES